MSVSEHGVDGSRSSSNWLEAAHSVHTTAPIGEYSPSEQAEQAVMLSSSRSALPAEHWIQELTPVMLSASQNWPGTQSVHGVAEFSSVSTCPGTQSLQSVSPQPAYLPTLQAVHSVAASMSSSALPLWQNAQTSAPLAAYWPGRQPLQSSALVARAAALNRPSGQSVHAADAPS